MPLKVCVRYFAVYLLCVIIQPRGSGGSLGVGENITLPITKRQRELPTKGPHAV